MYKLYKNCRVYKLEIIKLNKKNNKQYNIVYYIYFS